MSSKLYIVLVAIVATCIIVGSSATHKTSFDTIEHEPELSIVHDTKMLSETGIVIDGDGDVTGDIVNRVFDVSGTNGHGIEVIDTTTSFKIENVTIIGMSECGILLTNVVGIELINVTCVNNGDAGLRMENCDSIDISFSNFTNNLSGVEFLNTDSGNLLNSTCDANGYIALLVDGDSVSNTIRYNTFSCLDAILDVRDNDVSVSNTFLNNFYQRYTGVDGNDDKVGDTPHGILGLAGNEDTQPMMLPPDRPPLSWNTIIQDIDHEFGDSFYLDLDATIYGGLNEWTINNSMFSIDQNGTINEVVWLPIGNHLLDVVVSNFYNDKLHAIFFVNVVDTISPKWVDEPEDIYAELGSEFSYYLGAYDVAMPLIYYIDEIIPTPIFTIDPTTGIITNNSSLSIVDDYFIRSAVRDINNKWNFSDFFIHVIDSTAPSWDVELEDQILEFNVHVSYDIDASDLSGVTGFTIDDMTHFTINANGTITNTTALSVGEYPILVGVEDSYENYRNTSIIIHIVDTTAPQWIVRPTIHQVEYGDSLDIYIEAWDATGVSHFTISDPSVFDVTSTGHIRNFLPLEKKTYSLAVECYDLYGNSVETLFTVVVLDREAPDWTLTPTDLVVELDTEMNVQLFAEDPSGIANWSVDETNFFSISSTGVLSNATYLRVRSYSVHIRVTDPDGHTLLGIFGIQVVDTTPPVWSMLQREYNVTFPNTIAIQLIASDLSGIDHWDSNNSGIFTIDSAGLAQSGLMTPGIYNIEMTAYDSYNNSASITLIIYVRLADAGFFIITGTVGVAFLSSIVLIICMFDPKRGRIGFAKGGGTK